MLYQAVENLKIVLFSLFGELTFKALVGDKSMERKWNVIHN